MKLLEIRNLWQAGSGSYGPRQGRVEVHKNSRPLSSMALVRRVVIVIYMEYYLRSGIV